MHILSPGGCSNFNNFARVKFFLNEVTYPVDCNFSNSYFDDQIPIFGFIKIIGSIIFSFFLL